MKVCICADTFKTIVGWAIDGGMPATILRKLPKRIKSKLRSDLSPSGLKAAGIIKRVRRKRKRTAKQ